MSLKGKFEQKIEHDIGQRQEIRPLEKVVQRTIPKDAIYIEEEYVDEEDEEFSDITDDIDNVIDDVSVPPPEYRIMFYVIDGEVLTTSSSDDAKAVAKALEKYIHNIETKEDLWDLGGVLKGITKKRSRSGQRWSRSLVYLDMLDTAVPITFFLGGSGRQSKNDIYGKVKYAVTNHKEVFLDDPEWKNMTAEDFKDGDYIRDVFESMEEILNIGDIWKHLSTDELVNILIEVGIVRR